MAPDQIGSNSSTTLNSSGSGRRSRMGLRRVAADQGHLPLGRRARHRVRLEVHPEQLRRQHQPGQLLFLRYEKVITKKS